MLVMHILTVEYVALPLSSLGLLWDWNPYRRRFCISQISRNVVDSGSSL